MYALLNAFFDLKSSHKRALWVAALVVSASEPSAATLKRQ
jgi:hypothetical protein